MSDEHVPHQAPPAATPPTPSSSESVTPSKPSAASEFFRGIRTGLPVLSGCLPLGFILGVEAGRKGMTPLSIWMMTSINYAGGSEFAAVALWSAAPPMLVVWLTTWLINSRHIVMGASLSLYARHLPAKTNAFIYFLMCDEVWAIGSADIKRRSELGLPAHELLSLPFYVAVGLMFWSCWALSAAAGAWLGSDLGDLSHWGVQMAFPATFLSLLAMPRVRDGEPGVGDGHEHHALLRVPHGVFDEVPEHGHQVARREALAFQEVLAFAVGERGGFEEFEPEVLRAGTGPPHFLHGVDDFGRLHPAVR